MSWYDYTPLGAVDNLTGGHIKKNAKKAADWYDDATDRDPNDLQGGLEEQANKASGWADESRDRVGVLTEESAANRARLQDIATGKESVSAMQLAQANQQNQAMQQSMAAGARPANAAMAARTAAMNAGRQGAGLAGQQAIAGIQERQAATNSLTNALLNERGQDVQATGQGYSTATNAYGDALKSAMGTPTKMEKLMDLGGTVGQVAAFFSDKNLKENIKDGDDKASKLLKSLKAYEYDYKDTEHGDGKQLGILAQDLEKTDYGKMLVSEDDDGNKKVDGAKLAGALAAMLPAINKRLEALEGEDSDDDDEDDYEDLAEVLDK